MPVDKTTMSFCYSRATRLEDAVSVVSAVEQCYSDEGLSWLTMYLGQNRHIGSPFHTFMLHAYRGFALQSLWLPYNRKVWLGSFIANGSYSRAAAGLLFKRA